MAGDVTFRTQTVPTPQAGGKTNVSTGDRQEVSTSTTEVPYLDYEREHGSPLSVSFFELGDTWKDPTGGFPKEIGLIEEYFKNKVESGDIENSQSKIKDRLKEILKVTNMAKEGRNVIRVETVAAYIKFLMDADDIRYNIRRYSANSK